VVPSEFLDQSSRIFGTRAKKVDDPSISSGILSSAPLKISPPVEDSVREGSLLPPGDLNSFIRKPARHRARGAA